MTAQNLAVCLAPTLFQLSSRNMAMSPQRRHKTITGGLPNEKELNENRAAQACLAVMIDDCRRIFTVRSVLNLFSLCFKFVIHFLLIFTGSRGCYDAMYVQ